MPENDPDTARARKVTDDDGTEDDTIGADAIGYYVHHHGAGHLARYHKIVDASNERFVPISEVALPGGLCLPSDVVANGIDTSAGGALHWAPVGDHRSARRSRILGNWLADARPRGVVVDVSVEATLMCRLFGVATVVMRQHGDRTDPAHEMAYQSARCLLAPFPPQLEHPSTPAWIRQKTAYAGFIGGGNDETTASCGPSVSTPGPDDIVILWGAGGGELSSAYISNIVRCARGRHVWFAGQHGDELETSGVRALGWVNDVASLLCRAPTVIASAGNNVVADAALAGCALVVVPQHRPFHEQVRHAESLDAAQVAAVVMTGGDIDWGRAIDIARQRRSTLGQITGTGGATSAGEYIRIAFECVVRR